MPRPTCELLGRDTADEVLPTQLCPALHVPQLLPPRLGLDDRARVQRPPGRLRHPPGAVRFRPAERRRFHPAPTACALALHRRPPGSVDDINHLSSRRRSSHSSEKYGTSAPRPRWLAARLDDFLVLAGRKPLAARDTDCHARRPKRRMAPAAKPPRPIVGRMFDYARHAPALTFRLGQGSDLLRTRWQPHSGGKAGNMGWRT
jgi:hypothetical protein